MIQKNRFLFAGLPVIALALGMMVAGCDDGSTDDSGSKPLSSLAGKWYLGTDTNQAVKIEIQLPDTCIVYFNGSDIRGTASVSNGKFSLSMGGSVSADGTFDYTLSGGELTITNATGIFGQMDGVYKKK